MTTVDPNLGVFCSRKYVRHRRITIPRQNLKSRDASAVRRRAEIDGAITDIGA